MATILSFLSSRQITNSNGVPQAGALLYHYQAGTTNNLTVYSNQAGTTPHAQPVVCDSGGFVPLIYVGDTSDWKVVIQTAAGATLQTYDNLPDAVAEVSAADFSPPLFEWTQVTTTPQTLTAADAGKAYEADTTSNSIEFDLPSAASVGNGKGFLFKKTAAANSLIIDPSGSETIDDISTSMTVTIKDTAFGIFSNGAEWYRAFDTTFPLPTVQTFTSGTAATYTPPANVRFIKVRMVGGGGGGGAAATNAGGNGTTSSFASWTAILGNGGQEGGRAGATGSFGGAGGTGGANGSGTQITRLAGANGGDGAVAAAGTIPVGGSGGASPFGGAGVGAGGVTGGRAGGAAKANTGSGGGGAGVSTGGGTSTTAGSGGAGEYVEFFMTAAQIGASATYTVGALGAGGTAGTQAGGNGAAGIIIVEEYY